MSKGSFWDVLDELSQLLDPMKDHPQTKAAMKNIGISLIVFGCISLGISVTYLTMKSNTLMNLDVIVYMAIVSSALVIAFGILPMWLRNSSPVVRIEVAVVIFIISLVMAIYIIVLIGIGIHIMIMQRNSLIGIYALSVNKYRMFTLGIGASLLVIETIKAILFVLIIYLSTGLNELQIIYKVLDWKL